MLGFDGEAGGYEGRVREAEGVAEDEGEEERNEDRKGVGKEWIQAVFVGVVHGSEIWVLRTLQVF